MMNRANLSCILSALRLVLLLLYNLDMKVGGLVSSTPASATWVGKAGALLNQPAGAFWAILN